MPRHLIQHERTASLVGDTTHPAPRVRFPTRKRQDSRDSLGTVLSETIVMVSLCAV